MFWMMPSHHHSSVFVPVVLVGVMAMVVHGFRMGVFVDMRPRDRVRMLVGVMGIVVDVGMDMGELFVPVGM